MPFRYLALLLWFATATDSAPPQFVTIDRGNHSVTRDMRPLAVHVGGRVEVSGRNYRHQWPGVYFEAAFKGDRVILRFDDPANEYRAQIDDMPPLTLAQPGKSEMTIAALGSGAHRIRLDKVTESINVTTTFGGFYVPAGNALPAPPPRKRQIEFIGDSMMTGYGARSPRRECTSEEVRLLTDTPQSFAGITARHYGADYQINAISGRGLVRNYGGAAPDLAMMRVYPRVFPNQPTLYADSSWRPQIVMIKLQADFLGFKPEGRWKDLDALVADYIDSFDRFVGNLHDRAPEASILIWWFDTSRASPADQAMIGAAETRIADAARKAGVPNIGFLPFNGAGYANSGCHFHFNLDEQRKAADWLVLQIDAHPEYWGRR